MQYFKHMSNMRNDIKIKRVNSKYGLEGYGLYNLILESITESLTTQSPIPDLQETCADIAEFYNADTTRINEMLCFMVNQGLFEIDELTTRITCNKIYKYLEASQTRSEEIRTLITNYKDFNATRLGQSQTVTDKNEEEKRKEKKRREKKRREKSTLPLPAKTKHLDCIFLSEDQYNVLLEKYGKTNTESYINKANNYIMSKGKKYKSHYHTIVNWMNKDNIKCPDFEKPQQPEKQFEPEF